MILYIFNTALDGSFKVILVHVNVEVIEIASWDMHFQFNLPSL